MFKADNNSKLFRKKDRLSRLNPALQRKIRAAHDFEKNINNRPHKYSKYDYLIENFLLKQFFLILILIESLCCISCLGCLSEVFTAEMCRELASEVSKLIGSSAHYLKKKAILAATRIIRKVPEMTDEFMAKIENLSDEQHHGVLLSILAFIDDVITIETAV